MDGEGKIAKQVGQCGWYARVRVNHRDSGEQTRNVLLAAKVEDLWKSHSRDWLDAALLGASLGLAIADRQGVCSITDLRGHAVDTTPRIVAIAAIRAVWAAVSFQPADDMAARLEACITKSDVTPSGLEKELCG
jgi:hypothetical protein